MLFIITKGIMFAGFTMTGLYCDFSVINLSHYTGVAFVKGAETIIFCSSDLLFFTLGTAS